MKLQRLALLSVLILSAAVLTGCSGLGSNPLGGQVPGGSGSAGTSGSNAANGDGAAGPVRGDGVNTTVDCSAFIAAVTALFPAGVSSPLVQTPQTCVWGVGSNASATADVVGQSFSDIFSLSFSYGDDAEVQYQGDDGEITGGAANLTKIDGVGTAASYYDGGTGIPQVSAWSGKVACGAHLFIDDATTVGLASTGDGTHIVAASDTGALAKKVAEICAVGWKG
ncbi:MAG: hypothetical protein ABJA94_01260 [Rhodoglobus sp.]